jgi:hypothetical protein
MLTSLNDEYVIMMCDNHENRWMDWIPDPIDANPGILFKKIQQFIVLKARVDYFENQPMCSICWSVFMAARTYLLRSTKICWQNDFYLMDGTGIFNRNSHIWRQ